MDPLFSVSDELACRHAKQRAREAERRLTDLTDSMPGMVFQYRWRGPDDGCFLYTSRGIETVLGIRPPDAMSVQGGNRLFGFTEEARLQFIRDIAEHAQRLEPVDLEVTVQGKEALRYLQVRGNFTLQADGSRILNGVIQDITSLKLQEFELRAARQSAEEAMQVRSRFLATMSHELRTPISGMQGMLELLRISNLSEEQHDMVRSISHSARTLLYLVNDLLDFSAIEAGELQLRYQSCSLLQTVCDVIRSHATTAAGKGLSVDIHWDSSLPQDAVTDPMRMGQIISNLLSNAVKFTHEGSISVTARSQPSGHLTLTVSDTGIGIPEDKQHRLFTPFGQVDSDITRRYGGTGLGLAICDQLVRKMGGSISMVSKPGSGSHFTFTIPLREVRRQVAVLADSEWWLLSHAPEKYRFLQDMGATLRPVAPYTRLEELEGLLLVDEDCLISLYGEDGLSRLKALPLKGIIFSPKEPLRQRLGATGWWRLSSSPCYPDQLLDTCWQLLCPPEGEADRTQLHPLRGRILVADDHPLNRTLLAHQLTQMGLDVVLVSDGEQALQAWTEQHFDLLLTDLHMPEIDGYTLSRILRSRNVKTPVIGITADIRAGTRQHMLDCGINEMLPKPYTVECLYQALHRWLPTTEVTDGESTARIWGELFGDDRLARSMAEEYIRTSQEDCRMLADALLTGNTDALVGTAHRLKGSAGIASHTALEKKAARLETIARTASEEVCRHLVQVIQYEIDHYAQQTGAWIYG